MTQGPDQTKRSAKPRPTGGDGSGPPSAEEAIWETLKTLAPKDLTTDACQTLLRLLEISPNIAARYVSGKPTALPDTPQTKDLLAQILSRPSDHAGDTVGFVREIFDACGKLLKGEKALEALHYLVKISDKKIKYSDDTDHIQNQRNLRCERTVEITRAVKEEEPKRILDALNVMSTYNGDLDALGTFLKKAGTHNPYRATRETPFIIMNLFELDKEVQDSIITKRRDDGHGNLVPFAGKGDAGNFLVENGELYLTITGGTAFVSKRQAMLSIYRQWREEEFSEQRGGQRTYAREYLAKSTTRQVASGEFDRVKLEELIDKAALEKYGDTLGKLAHITLGELLEHPEFQTISRKSPVLARELQLFKDLSAEIDQLMSSRYRLLLGEDLTAPQGSISRILSEPGGKLFKFIERRIEEELQGKGQVPDYVKLAYRRLTDPDQPLSPKQELFYTQGLLAWEAQQRCVSSRAVFSGVLKDLDLYHLARETKDQLPQDHPIHSVTSHFDRIAEELRGVLNSKEVSIAQAASTIERLGVVSEWRDALNRYNFSKYSSAFSESVEKLRWLFQDQVPSTGTNQTTFRWKPDCLGGSVPMDRLRQTVYGAPATNEQQAALIQTDLRQVMRALSLIEFNRRENDATFFQAIGIEDFKTMTVAVCRAARKADAFDIVFHEAGLALPENASRDNARDFLKDKHLPILVGGTSNSTRMLPAEELFEIKDGRVDGSARTATEELQEVVARARARFSTGRNGHASFAIWDELTDKLIPRARVGLYLDPVKLIKGDPAKGIDDQHISGRETRLIQELHRDLLSLVPIDTHLAEQIESAAKVIRSPLVEISSEQRNLFMRAQAQWKRTLPAEGEVQKWCDGKGYLTASELQLVKECSVFRPTFDKLGLADTPELRELNTKAGKYQHLNIYDIQPGDDGKPKLVAHKPSNQDFGQEQSETFTYYNPNKLREFITELESSPKRYLTSTEVAQEYGPNFLRMAGTIVGFDPKTSLNSLDYLLSYSGLIERRALEVIKGALVEREQAARELVVNKAQLKPGDPIGTSSGFVWGLAGRKQELEPIINFGKHQGKSIFETPVSYLEWFVRSSSPIDERRQIIEHFLPYTKIPRNAFEQRRVGREVFLNWVEQEMS